MIEMFFVTFMFKSVNSSQNMNKDLRNFLYSETVDKDCLSSNTKLLSLGENNVLSLLVTAG